MLKIRQARELQKFDFARKLLRMLKRFPAARRALCAASGGVADRLCLFQKLLRQKPDPAGAFHTDEASECACEQQTVDLTDLDAEMTRHQSDARGDRALGKLHLAHIVLRQPDFPAEPDRKVPFKLLLRLESPAPVDQPELLQRDDRVDQP